MTQRLLLLFLIAILMPCNLRSAGGSAATSIPPTSTSPTPAAQKLSAEIKKARQQRAALIEASYKTLNKIDTTTPHLSESEAQAIMRLASFGELGALEQIVALSEKTATAQRSGAVQCDEELTRKKPLLDHPVTQSLIRFDAWALWRIIGELNRCKTPLPEQSAQIYATVLTEQLDRRAIDFLLARRKRVAVESHPAYDSVLAIVRSQTEEHPPERESQGDR